MFHFLETNIREETRYKKRIQRSVDNTVHDLHYEIKFENCVKDKINFLLSRIFLFFFKQNYFLFFEMYFFKIPRNLVASVFFVWRQILKKQICLGKSLCICWLSRQILNAVLNIDYKLKLAWMLCVQRVWN